MDDEIAIDRDAITDLFMRAAGDSAAHRLYSDLSIRDTSDVIAVFAYSKKMRILYDISMEARSRKVLTKTSLDRKTHERLKKLAKGKGLTISEMMEEII